jgi:hypothetical protein
MIDLHLLQQPFSYRSAAMERPFRPDRLQIGNLAQPSRPHDRGSIIVWRDVIRLSAFAEIRLQLLPEQ